MQVAKKQKDGTDLSEESAIAAQEPASDLPEDMTDGDEFSDDQHDEDEEERDSTGEMPEPEDPADAPEEPETDAGHADDASDNPHAGDLPPDAVVEEKVVERIVERRGGFLPALLGGVLAAAVGFVAGRGELLDSLFPRADATADLRVKVTNLSGTVSRQGDLLDTQGETLAALAGQVDGIAIPDLAPLAARIDALSGLEDRAARLNSDIATLAGRLTEVEKRPISEGLSEAAIAAYENELKALQAAMEAQRRELETRIATQRDEVSRLVSDAQAKESAAVEAALRAENQAAAADILSALDSGAPYAGAIGILSGNGVEVPAPLAASASGGVATLTSIQDGFDDAARAGLAAARASAGGSSGLGGFIQRQLGARSVTPRDGDDADSILSRAGAAVSGGDLGTGLSEIAALPEAAQSAMSDWIATTETRHAATTAADALVQSLSAK